MTSDEENFAVQLTDLCDSHEKWLAVIRFGFVTLLKKPDFLIELIVREAERQRDRTGLEHRRVSDDAAVIVRELGLQFVDRNESDAG